MSEEQSLEAFSSTDSTTDEAGGGTDGAETTGTEPATVTYRWQPDRAVCAQCGESSERQWLDGDEFVCPDCKSWA